MPFTDPFVANPFPFAVANTLPLANTLYDVTASLVSGVYTISWSGGGTLNIDFYNGTTLVTSASGTSSITVNLAQSVTNYKLWLTVAGASVVISLSGLATAPISGTIYSYSTSQIIPLVGDGYFLLVGAAGGSVTASGGSGGIVTGRITLTGLQAFVVGIAGNSAVYNGAATAGTASTFAGFTAGGGGGANGSTPGSAGSPNGVIGATGNSPGSTTSTAAVISGFSFFTIGSTGSGGAAGGGGGAAGGGIGIGTGGFSTSSGNGGSATGFGASGGGTQTPGSFGGASTGGLLYIVL